jgi:GntR family transcriptional regulator
VIQRREQVLSLITVDLRDRKQLYEQLIDNIKALILSGDLKRDDKLPSVRSLAKELGINPNTIQKAYTELERCGIIVSMPGRGSMVLAERDSLRDEMSGKLENAMAALAREMRESGIGREEFVRAAEEAWDRMGGNQNDQN